MPNEDEVVALLRAGKNVVTPVGWVYPDPATTGALLAACEAGGSTLHGTGIHPGGITERFPLMVSALSAGVTHVRSEEFSDIRTYGAPDVIRHIMAFGATPEEAKGGMIVGLLSGGFKQSVQMIVDEMGFDADPELTTAPRGRRGDGAHRLADRDHRARAGRRPAVHLAGARSAARSS